MNLLDCSVALFLLKYYYKTDMGGVAWFSLPMLFYYANSTVEICVC